MPTEPPGRTHRGAENFPLSIALLAEPGSAGQAIALDLTLCVDAPDGHEAVVAVPAARSAQLGPGNEMADGSELSMATLTRRYRVLAGG